MEQCNEYTGGTSNTIGQEMPVTVDYYHFLISPWSYLAIPRINGIRERTGAHIRYLPIDVGRTFGEMGGTPPGQRHASRQSWRLEEMKRFSDHLDMPMNLKPAFFPVDQTLAARLVIAAGDADSSSTEGGASAAGQLSDAVLTACWRDEADVSDRATLMALLDGLGMDSAALISAAESDAIAARYAATTDEAHKREVFGSPTLVVDGERFWGQDRLDFAEAAIVAAG